VHVKGKEAFLFPATTKISLPLLPIPTLLACGLALRPIARFWTLAVQATRFMIGRRLARPTGGAPGAAQAEKSLVTRKPVDGSDGSARRPIQRMDAHLLGAHVNGRQARRAPRGAARRARLGAGRADCLHGLGEVCVVPLSLFVLVGAVTFGVWMLG